MVKKEKRHNFQVRFSETTMLQINELQIFLNTESIADTIRQAIAERHKFMTKQKEGYSIFGIKDTQKVEFLI